MPTALSTVRSDIQAALSPVDAQVYRQRQVDYQFPAVVVGWPESMDLRAAMGGVRDFVINVNVGVVVGDDASSDEQLENLLEDCVEVLTAEKSWDVQPVTDFANELLSDGRAVLWCRIPVAVFE